MEVEDVRDLEHPQTCQGARVGERGSGICPRLVCFQVEWKQGRTGKTGGAERIGKNIWESTVVSFPVRGELPEETYGESWPEEKRIKPPRAGTAKDSSFPGKP